MREKKTPHTHQRKTRIVAMRFPQRVSTHAHSLNYFFQKNIFFFAFDVDDEGEFRRNEFEAGFNDDDYDDDFDDDEELDEEDEEVEEEIIV